MNKNYKVARKDVYAGRIERNKYILRSILFTPDVDDKAIDLIYDTPLTYDVKKTSNDNNLYEELSQDLAVTNSISLNAILKKLGYGDYLTQKDLDQIYRRLIVSDKWMFRYKSRIDFLNARMLISDEYALRLHKQADSIIHDLAKINLINNGKPTVEEPGHSLTFKRR